MIKCNLSLNNFVSEILLRKHITEHHQKILICPACIYLYELDNTIDFRDHLKENHKYLLMCDFCCLAFDKNVKKFNYEICEKNPNSKFSSRISSNPEIFKENESLKNRISDLEKENNELKKNNDELRERERNLNAILEETSRKIDAGHVSIYGVQSCIKEPDTLSFAETIRNLTSKFTEKRRNRYTYIWGRFIKYFEEKTTSMEKKSFIKFANDFFMSLKKKSSTLNGYVYCIEKILRAYFNDQNLRLNTFQITEASKKKYRILLNTQTFSFSYQKCKIKVIDRYFKLSNVWFENQIMDLFEKLNS